MSPLFFLVQHVLNIFLVSEVDVIRILVGFDKLVLGSEVSLENVNESIFSA